MHTVLRSLVLATAVAALELVPAPARAQAAALTALLGNATDINVFYLLSGAPKTELKPSGDRGADGLGFELSFAIPGGWSRTRSLTTTTVYSATDNSCAARFYRHDPLFFNGNAVIPNAKCADTTWKPVERRRDGSTTRYKDAIDIKEFSLSEPVVTLELAVGFAQSGAYVARQPDNDLRVSIRETPSLSVYATVQHSLLDALPLSPSLYVGARSGLVTLNGGRAFTPTSTIKFGGETFQLGGVAGLVTEMGGVNAFVEGSWMWRDFKSVDWDVTGPFPATLPRHMDLSGFSLAAGFQFELKEHPGK